MATLEVQMPMHRERVFIGIGGCAVAIDAATGEELWRTHLKGSSFTTIWQDGKRLYAGASGELFAVDAETGTILWHNKLKGLGTGIIAFASSAEQAAATAAAAAAAAAAVAASAG